MIGAAKVLLSSVGEGSLDSWSDKPRPRRVPRFLVLCCGAPTVLGWGVQRLACRRLGTDPL